MRYTDADIDRAAQRFEHLTEDLDPATTDVEHTGPFPREWPLGYACAGARTGMDGLLAGRSVRATSAEARQPRAR